MKTLNIGIIALIMTSGTTFAQEKGERIGNGGGVVACYNQAYGTPGAKIISAELLDYFESSEQTTLKLDLGGSSLSVDQKVMLVIDRIKKHEPYRAVVMTGKYNEFQRRSKQLGRSAIKAISDTHELIKPDGFCYRMQGAVQIKNPEEFEFKYLIDQDIWNTMDKDQQAGLILHETLYSMAIEQGATNSDAVRKYVGIVSSSEFSSWSPERYLRFVSKYFNYLYFNSHVETDFTVWTNSIAFDHLVYSYRFKVTGAGPMENYILPDQLNCVENALLKLDMKSGAVIACSKIELDADSVLRFSGLELDLRSADFVSVELFPNGRLKTLDIHLSDRNSWLNKPGKSIQIPIPQENRIFTIKRPSSAFGPTDPTMDITVEYEENGDVKRISNRIVRVGANIHIDKTKILFGTKE